MFFGRKVIIASFLAMSLMLMFALFMYRPLSKIQVEETQNSMIKSFSRAEKIDNNSYCKTLVAKVKGPSFRKLDLQQLEIPMDITDKVSSIEILSDVVKIGNNVVHYRTGRMQSEIKDSVPVLLLHGKAYSSKTWEDLHSIQYITAFGIRAVAIDLPAKSFNRDPPNDKGEFLQKIITALNMTRPIIVSPSMSGSYSIPYLMSHWQNVSGFVTISPIGTASLKQAKCGEAKEYVLDSTCYSWMQRVEKEDFPDMSCIMVPVLIISGEKDEVTNSARLCRLPWSKGVEIPGGEHAAYLSNPQLWHKLLYNFLVAVNAAYICEK